MNVPAAGVIVCLSLATRVDAWKLSLNEYTESPGGKAEAGRSNTMRAAGINPVRATAATASLRCVPFNIVLPPALTGGRVLRQPRLHLALPETPTAKTLLSVRGAKGTYATRGRRKWWSNDTPQQ